MIEAPDAATNCAPIMEKGNKMVFTKVISDPAANGKPLTRAEEISPERGRTHGGFGDNAQIAQTLRREFRSMPNWLNMTYVQQTALDEIALKIGRLGSSGSDPGFKEHWDDIAGYANLGGKG